MSAPKSVADFKRRYPRRVFYGAVGVIYKGQYALTTASSLGEGGMSFLWPQPLPFGSMVTLTFKIPGNTMISIRAEIRNARPPKDNPHHTLGVQFLPLPIAEKRPIRAYVSARSEEEPMI